MQVVAVNIKVPGLVKLMNAVTNGAGMEKTLLQWGAIYRSFAQRRYVKAAAGDGTWKPLAQVTVLRRRVGKRKKGKAQILRDTGTMFKVLDPVYAGAPGAMQIVDSRRIAVTLGYGGGGQHPAKGKSARTTVAMIAGYHQVGNKRLPKREIIVKPDDKTMKQMVAVAKKNLTDIGNNKTT